MKYIASCSFGKDSIAAIITRIEQGEPIDEIVYCRIMYDDDISAEYPKHEEFIHNKAIPQLERRYGLKTTIVQSDRTYKDWFYRVTQKGISKGKINGFPRRKAQWCTSKLKTQIIHKHNRQLGKYKNIVGIAADEPKRIERALKRGEILPLVDYGITETIAFDICKKHDLLSPEYGSGTTRLGCWFCHNQRIGELRRLRQNYPELWGELMRIEKDSPFTFKPNGRTIHDCDRRFALEDEGLISANDRRFRWSDIDGNLMSQTTMW